MSEPEDFFSALGTTIACALSQCWIVDACPFQVQRFARRVLLDIGKLDPEMFSGSSPLVLGDDEHQPWSCA